MGPHSGSSEAKTSLKEEGAIEKKVVLVRCPHHKSVSHQWRTSKLCPMSSNGGSNGGNTSQNEVGEIENEEGVIKNKAVVPTSLNEEEDVIKRRRKCNNVLNAKVLLPNIEQVNYVQ